MPSPPIPPGLTVAAFGERVMDWGTGDKAARRRMQILTRRELEVTGVTLAMAREWRDFYVAVKAKNPRNPSAAGRSELMQRAVDLLEK